MPETVLVPFDGSPLSEQALKHALEQLPSASVTAIYVIDPFDSVIAVEAGGLPVAEEWYENAKEQADTVLSTATEIAADHDVDLTTDTATGPPAREILDYAAEHDFDQIVMGSHGREGIERAIFGSVAETVTRRTRIPVAIIK